MNARPFDLTPFHRGTVGFENLINVLTAQHAGAHTGYPPYNIVRIDDNQYQIELAVAGFSMNELSITQDKNDLIIEGIPMGDHEDDVVMYLHKGIANRSFKKTFTLANHVEVKSATLELGILNINLERNVPDELLPKKIAISAIKS